MQNHNLKFSIILAFITLFIIGTHATGDAGSEASAKTVFYVHWYDVGQAALEGLPGIKEIEKGFHNFKEINTVYYDPSLISVAEMEQALKKAGTYIGTAK